MPSKKRKQTDLEEEEEADSIQVDEAPTSINPYTVLSLTPDATQSQINSAYRKAALKCHPDKVQNPSDKDTAHAKFQEVAFAYAILSDERRRKRYDSTGRTEETLDDDDFDWADFFRAQYANAVTFDAIEDFKSGYKGSEEERGHVLDAYRKVEGDMGKLYSRVMLSDVLEDDERFRGIVDAAIEAGEVKRYPKYVNETEKSKNNRIAQAMKQRDKEAKEAAEAAKEIEDNPKYKVKQATGQAKGKKDAGMGDLASLIQQRQKGRAEGFFDRLETKYADNGKKGAKKASEGPSEEDFARNREYGKAKKAKR